MGIIRDQKNHRLYGQSELHQELSQMVLVWAANRATLKGSKGGIEIWVPKWGLADAVIVQTFQSQYAERFGLISKSPDNPYMFLNPEVLLVFETKVSRPDFARIFKKIEKGGGSPGSMNWIVAPKRLIWPGELPAGWGLLEPYGSGLKITKLAAYTAKPELEILRVQSGMLWDSRWYRKHLKIGRCPDCGKSLDKPHFAAALRKAEGIS